MPRATRRKYRKKSKTRRVRKKKRVVKRKRRRTKSKKSIAKSKRRVKLINKTIKRVQTKLADDVVVMRRMKHLQSRLNVNGGEVLSASELDVRHPTEIYDGQLALNKYVGLPVKYSDWWNINAFHGFIKPRYYGNIIGANDGNQYDPDWEPRKPWDSYSELFSQDIITNTFGPPNAPAVAGMDILAYDQREIPFLPCVPRHIDVSQTGTTQPFYSRLNDFARKGDRIKVRSNYMRFNFYVQAGIGKIKPVFAGNGAYEVENSDQQTSGYGGAIKEYTLSARSMAKARIIVVKRNSADSAPINLNDFLKDNNPYSMGDEFYRMGKYFNRKYKTDNDIIVNTTGSNDIDTEISDGIGKITYISTKLKDISNETQRGLHNVQIMYDKVHNLRVGGETVVKLSLMKGTVLKYESQNPAYQEIYTNPQGAYNSLVNNETAKPELLASAGNNDVLPTHTNDVLRKLNNIIQTPETKQAHNEYVPTGAKYAAFLLLMNQKCSTEYQIFQKFEFDN